jgi:hypothetical protein
VEPRNLERKKPEVKEICAEIIREKHACIGSTSLVFAISSRY